MIQDQEIDTNARILWDYMKLDSELVRADAIIALGTNDLRIAEHAVSLWQSNWAPIIINTGGVAHQGDINDAGWKESEAEMYKAVEVKYGVPESAIILEEHAKSLGDNATIVKEMLSNNGNKASMHNFIIACKPTVARRARAVFSKRWPEASFIYSSPDSDYDDYVSGGSVGKDVIINVLVGDIQRLRVYAESEYHKHKDLFTDSEWQAINKAGGYQADEMVPAEVWEAYEKLVSMGYNKYTLEYIKQSKN